MYRLAFSGHDIVRNPLTRLIRFGLVRAIPCASIRHERKNIKRASRTASFFMACLHPVLPNAISDGDSHRAFRILAMGLRDIAPRPFYFSPLWINKSLYCVPNFFRNVACALIQPSALAWNFETISGSQCVTFLFQMPRPKAEPGMLGRYPWIDVSTASRGFGRLPIIPVQMGFR
jgi:hypothetical protein